MIATKISCFPVAGVILSLKTRKILMIHCQQIDHLYICSVSKIIQDKLWQTILQDTLATEAFMVYNNGELSKGYDIIEKARQYKIVSFNGIKLIAQE